VTAGRVGEDVTANICMKVEWMRCPLVDTKAGAQKIAEVGFDGLNAEIAVGSNVGIEGCVIIGLKVQAECEARVRLSIGAKVQFKLVGFHEVSPTNLVGTEEPGAIVSVIDDGKLNDEVGVVDESVNVGSDGIKEGLGIGIALGINICLGSRVKGGSKVGL
jgi:hypothetical protein